MSPVADVTVPDIGDFADVPVIEIHVGPGDEVSVEDPLVTLESDKATMDVPAPFAGTVKQLRVKIGDRVSEGSVLLVLEAESAEPGPAPPSHGPPHEQPPPDGPPPAATPEQGASARGSRGASHETEVLVIGSGPGGYTAAFRAADLGLKATLVERYDVLGGVCLNVGCIPSKALLHAARVIAEAQEMGAHGISFADPQIDLPALRSWTASIVGKLTGGLDGLAQQREVEVIPGVAQFVGPHAVRIGEREVTFDSCIIAAGSRAARLPDLPDDPRIVDSTGALALEEVPNRMLVIGGGIIGLELATVYEALGSRVTVVELLDELIVGCDRDLVAPLQRRIEARYESILLGTQVAEVAVQKRGLKVTLSSGESEVFNRVLVAVGRKPNGDTLAAEKAAIAVDEHGFIPVDAELRTNVPHIYAIGDLTPGPMLAHRATHQGKAAAEVIAGAPGARFDPRAVPSVAYTDPEVAWTGLTETAAKENGVEYDKAVFPWSASGRALGLARDEGLTKLLFQPGTRRLLGAGIVGVGAGDLIAETAHALEMGADAEDLAATVHPHPTLSETIGFAAEIAEGTITDLMPRRVEARAP